MKILVITFLFLVLSQVLNAEEKLNEFLKETNFEKLEGKAPDFKLVTTKNDTISLESFKGNFLLIHFWATWCKPCRKEIPEFEKLNKDFEKIEAKILGVSIDSQKDSLKAIKFANKFSFTNSLVISGEISEDYWSWGIPTTILVSKEGVLLGRVRGVVNWRKFSESFKDFLQK